jgi:hypothetical protein
MPTDCTGQRFVPRDVQSHLLRWYPVHVEKQHPMNKKSRSSRAKRPSVKLTVVAPSIRRKSKKNKKNRKKSTRPILSPASAAFMKVATASCDFTTGSTNFVGIPDEYDGPVVTETQNICTAFTPVSGLDNYIVLLPTPGVAFWTGSRTAGTTGAMSLTGSPYDDSTTYIPTGAENSVINAFRYAANAIELVNLTNSMTWSGAIEVFKAPIRMTGRAGAISSLFIPIPLLEGLSVLNSIRPDKVFPIKDGVYVPAFNQESTYPFTPIIEDETWANLSTNQADADAPENVYSFACTTPFVGLGSLEAVIIKIPAAAASQSLLIRTWSALEYQVPRTSILYNLSHYSPAYDPQALALLHAFHKNFVGSVCAKDNATFWANLVMWVRRFAGIAAHIPGPVGTIGSLSTSILDAAETIHGGEHGLW